jgi:GNAT superfamily N-acetyltransferase
LLLGPMSEEVGHHHEQSPLDPDYSQYLQLELVGVLRFLAVRDKGRLVGFLLCTVGPHMDFMSTRWASILKLYLKPSYRRGGRAPKMLRLAHEMMQKSGVKVVTAASRTGYTTARKRGVASLLEFAGYSPIETVYAKALE